MEKANTFRAKKKMNRKLKKKTVIKQNNNGWTHSIKHTLFISTCR